MRKFTIGAVALLLAACGGGDDADYTVETEDGTAEYSIDDDGEGAEIRFTDEEGNETVINAGGRGDSEVSLPDGFTLYPGAQVVMNNTMSGAEGNVVMLVFTSSDSAEDLIAHYRGQAEAAGVEIQMELTTADAKVIAGEGPNDLGFNFSASDGDGQTTGTLTVGRQP